MVFQHVYNMIIWILVKLNKVENVYYVILVIIQRMEYVQVLIRLQVVYIMILRQLVSNVHLVIHYQQIKLNALVKMELIKIVILQKLKTHQYVQYVQQVTNFQVLVVVKIRLMLQMDVLLSIQIKNVYFVFLDGVCWVQDLVLIIIPSKNSFK